MARLQKSPILGLKMETLELVSEPNGAVCLLLGAWRLRTKGDFSRKETFPKHS